MKPQTNTYNPAVTDLKFQAVTDDDIPLLSRFFDLYPSRSCDFSIGGVLLWKNFYDYRFTVVRDSLIILGTWPGTETCIFYEPRGPLDYNTYKRIVFDYCNRNNLKGFMMLPEEYLPSEEEDPRPIDDMLMADWMEYLYDIDKFKNFPGHKMGKKRNHLNFFLNHYPDCDVREITEGMAADLISFTIAFSENHSDDAVAMYECHEIIEALKNYSGYPYFGIAIYHNDEPIGYTFGERIGDTMIIHAEKGNIEYGGIYQALASRLALAVAERYPDVRYLNREDDMGSEDLRKSKLSYHPSLFIAKRIITI